MVMLVMLYILAAVMTKIALAGCEDDGGDVDADDVADVHASAFATADADACGVGCGHISKGCSYSTMVPVGS